ncbi:hypothetical protein DU002_17760 [Corallincola holothuriorum]|uniref:FlgO domain-containing protein n=1 Tax=Corallincola holothuriorum TaxID=2282215 RepID=A0A368N4U5_9GAMM|nr:FlgO family outer membrane protein [Corallincola holothuriorum]RCU44604.1 hypothetical protein DU002_17760 [Corallincola holothuriorum]
MSAEEPRMPIEPVATHALSDEAWASKSRSVMISSHVEAMAEELVGTMSQRCFKMMAVASFVDIETLNVSSPLGTALAESFITQMQQQGCKVVDFKLRNDILVTSTGDFVFSRNFNQLKGDLPIVQVLSGTLQPMSKGVQVNVRLVDIASKIVVGSAQGFIPNELLAEITPSSMRDGVQLMKQG